MFSPKQRFVSLYLLAYIFSTLNFFIFCLIMWNFYVKSLFWLYKYFAQVRHVLWVYILYCIPFCYSLLTVASFFQLTFWFTFHIFIHGHPVNLKRSEFMCSIRFFLSIIPTRAFCPSVPMWNSSSLGLLITPIILRLLFTIFLGITFVLIVFFYYGSLPFPFIV